MRREDDMLSVAEEEIVAEGDTRTLVEKEEDWLYFHLDCARHARSRMTKLAIGSPQWLDEDRNRRAAALSAMKHYGLLRRMSSPIPPLLDSMMRSEGL